MTTEIREVSPALAAELLSKNTANRAVNKRAVARYAEAMKRGVWRIGNDAICVGLDGVLLNGQHRLNAVVESGVTVKMLFRSGVEQGDLFAMDQGNKRIGADIATLTGHAITRGQAKALRLLGTEWSARTTMATPAVDELIQLDQEWTFYLEQGVKLVLPSKRNMAIPVAIAADALRWQGLDGRQQMIADFFSIIWENTPAADRPTDSKGVDFIPCQFHRYANTLAKDNKQLRSFHQHKLVVAGLHAYMTGQVLTKAKQIDVEEISVPASNPFRG
jgi:hypothetical protein